jgi:hypothetical protein
VTRKLTLSCSGKTLTITASGTLEEDVEEGAKVHLQVKFGLITLINQEADLCDQVKNVDLSCPLKKGDMTLTKEVDLPAQIPPVCTRFFGLGARTRAQDCFYGVSTDKRWQGKYTVLADVYTKDGDKITCLTATVWFHR